jgi:membrane protease YdiL (CAAX protease family)
MGLWAVGRDPRRFAGDIWAGFSLAIPTILGTLILAGILVRVMGASPEPPLPPARSGPGLLANLLAAAVIAPIGEELFFRGYATTAWARRLGAETALVRGSLFFAFVHVLALSGSSFDQVIRSVAVTFVSRLPVAYLLGWLYLRRRSLYASIALHATFNGLLVILSVVGS